MLIGELAQKTNLSRHTIRFYEKMGLINVPVKSRRDNNYKEYPEETLKQLRAIQHIKSQGFTLKEARGIIDLIQTGTLDPERGRKYILKKVHGIEKQIEELLRARKNLLVMADKCGTENCDVDRILKESFHQAVSR
ncbi:MAG TPA: MerR family transcriptional regulator [Ohtaekwangia sp.]